jgi:hypothetical protein
MDHRLPMLGIQGSPAAARNHELWRRLCGIPCARNNPENSLKEVNQ